MPNQVEDMRYHGPGWRMEVGDTTFSLWAPQIVYPRWLEGEGHQHIANENRTKWVVNQSTEHDDGDTYTDFHESFVTPEEAIARFTIERVRELFMEALDESDKLYG